MHWSRTFAESDVRPVPVIRVWRREWRGGIVCHIFIDASLRRNWIRVADG